MKKYIKNIFARNKNKSSCPKIQSITFDTFGPSQELNKKENLKIEDYVDEERDEDTQLELIERALEELEEEEQNENKLQHSNYKAIRTKNEVLINTYKPSHVNLYKNQDINEIRRRNKPFIDPLFPCNINSILEPNTQQDCIGHLFNEFKVHNRFDYTELNSKIFWKRPQAICYDTRIGRYEFVLDSWGRSLKDKFTVNDFVKCLSSDDVFQGMMGDCFMIATFLSICSNKELMAHIVPIDNAYRNNMKIGAYHFRLWKLGEWHDVVVDDYLPLDTKYCPLFVKNLQFRNEFWICLFEKCVAKFVGKYEHLNGGFTESISLTFSGGIQNMYLGEVLKHVSYGTPVTDANANQMVRALTEQFGSVQAAMPNVDELFIIFQQALKNKNLIGCHSNLDISTRMGIIKTHQYAVTSAFVMNNMKLVRVQNPHNQPDEIKKTHQYYYFELSLIQQGAPRSYYGEFYMQFQDFVNCFDIICVYNLLPEKPFKESMEQYKALKLKSNLFTQWTILHLRGQMSGTNMGAQFRIDFEVRTSSREHLMLTICQNYDRFGFLAKLNLFKNMQPMATYTSNTYAAQQVFNLFLDSGTYTGVFEAATEIKKSPDVCARIFYSKSNNNSVRLINPLQ